MILSIDFGTTNRKAALIDESGAFTVTVSIPAQEITEDGHPVYDSVGMKDSLSRLVSALPREKLASVRLITLSGMAEAGLLADANTLEPLTNIWPWFDTRTLPVFEEMKNQRAFHARQCVTGLPDSPKYGIYKLLTMLRTGNFDRRSVVWMSLLSFVASLLTGDCAEDVTLASRTGCLSLAALGWDEDFLSELDLSSRNFPALIAQGDVAGSLNESFCGVPKGTPVAIAGHDHICAAAATDDLKNGGLFLSCGTAQVLLKTTQSFEAESGLSYGPGFDGRFIALGSIQSAGGSINLFKQLLYPGQDYSVMLDEAAHREYPPALTYYPYLAGSGAPHADPLARAALIGLGNDTERGDILCSVYAGIALETRFLAKSLLYDPSRPITCIGGLTRHTRYMQILSDVLGACVNVPVESEGTLYGAARLSGEVNGIVSLPPLQTGKQYTPSADYAAHWDKMYGDYLVGMRRLYDKES